MTRVRLGITQRVLDTRRDERRDCLDQRWFEWFDPRRYLLVPLSNALTAEQLAVTVDDLELSGFVLSGGNDLDHLVGATDSAPERDAFEGGLLDLAESRALPVLGVCRGMQHLVARAGGALERRDGHAGTSHGVERVDDRWPLQPARVVNSYHDWCVIDPGASFRPLAVAADGTVEAVAHRTFAHVGIMWHPERDRRDAVDRDLVDTLFGADSPGLTLAGVGQ